MVPLSFINYSKERISSDAIRGYDVANSRANAINADAHVLQQQPEVAYKKSLLTLDGVEAK